MKISNFFIFLIITRIFADYLQGLILAEILTSSSVFHFSKIATFFIIFFIIIYFLKKKLLLDKIGLLLLFFVFILLLYIPLSLYNMTACYEINPINVFIVWGRFFAEFLIYAFLFNVLSSEIETNKFIKKMFISLSVVVIGISVFQLFIHSERIIQGIERIYGPFSSPNMLAGVCFILMGLSVYYSLLYGKFYIIISALFFYFIIKTGSMNALLMSGIFYLFVFLFYGHKIKKKRISFLFSLSMLAIIFFNIKYLIRRINMFVFLSTFSILEGSSISWRKDTWNTYIDEWKTSLLFGKGIGVQRAILAGGTHNDYIAMLVDGGIVGLLIFIVFLFLFLTNAKKHIKKVRNAKTQLGIITILGLWTSFCIGMFFDNFIDNIVIFILIIFSAAFLKLAHIENKNILCNEDIICN